VKEPIEEKWQRMFVEQKLDALLSLTMTMQRSLDLCIAYVQANAAENIAKARREELDTQFSKLQAERKASEGEQKPEDDIDTDRPTNVPHPESKS
jgi:hypothetical protein